MLFRNSGHLAAQSQLRWYGHVGGRVQCGLGGG